MYRGRIRSDFPDFPPARARRMTVAGGRRQALNVEGATARRALRVENLASNDPAEYTM